MLPVIYRLVRGGKRWSKGMTDKYSVSMLMLLWCFVDVVGCGGRVVLVKNPISTIASVSRFGQASTSGCSQAIGTTHSWAAASPWGVDAAVLTFAAAQVIVILVGFGGVAFMRVLKS
jgi:hypothetical protein